MQLFRSMRWLLLALLFSVIPVSSTHAQVSVSVGFAPPMLPVYEQPYCPEPNLMWVPGYWAWGDGDYYWVPGAWVPAPYEGALWTPNYWDWSGGRYRFHRGYWGRHVGYYGGVNYGFGYMGIGFSGGEWRGGSFAYNTAVMRVNQSVIHTTYNDRTVVERNTIANDRHVAYSGGPGGIRHAAAPQERAAEREQHAAPTSFQTQHINAARADKSSFAKANGGHPQNVVSARPLGGGARPVPQQQSRPAPQQHATPAQQQHTNPQQQARPAPQQQSRPAAQQHATPAQQQHTAPAPQQQARPAPQQQSRPVAQQHATPAPQEHTAPVPQQQARPAPQQQSRPAAQQHAAPAPQQHTAPAPQLHAAPAPREESKPKGH
jgi:hypothetical protein